MIIQKTVAKFFVIMTALFLFTNSLFATDISVGFHYDNYGTENDPTDPTIVKLKNNFGGSINLTEFITDEFSIQAAVENKKNNNYMAHCSAGYEWNFFSFLGGFLFDLRDSKFSPGFLLNGNVKLFNFFTVGANTKFAFSTKNIFENYITEIESYLIFHCKNQDVTLSFNYSHEYLLTGINQENKKKDFSLGGYLDVLALDERSPFKIGLFLGVESYKKNYDINYNVLDLNVGGRFIFDLKKFGFIIKGESTVYKFNEEQPLTPFALSLTTRFSF